MNYIINPMWIYWIKIIGEIKEFLMFLCIPVTIATMIVFAVYNSCLKVTPKDDEIILRKKLLKTLLIFSAITIFAIFIPTTETLIEMKIAKLITTENLNFGIEAAKSILNDIVTAIKSI